MNEGWIKIFYRLLEWEWYSDTNMVRLFIHLLLKANYRPQKWRGREIPRGSLITTRSTLVEETNLTAQQIRTCITRLISTNEITSETTNSYTIITICNYELYQADFDDANQRNNQAANQRITNEQPTNNQPIGKKGRREEIKEKEIEINKEKEKESFGGENRGYQQRIDELLDKWIAEASESEIWLEAVAKNLQMKPPEVVDLMRNEFRDHCIRDDVRHFSLTDFRKHFNRWASQQKYSSTNETGNPTNNTGRRPGGIAAKLPPQPACGIKRRPDSNG